MKKNQTTIELILKSFEDLLDRFNYIKSYFQDYPYPPYNIVLFMQDHKENCHKKEYPVSYYICSCVNHYTNKNMYPKETILVLKYYLKNIPKELLERSYWCMNEHCDSGYLSPEEVLELGYPFWNYPDIDSRIEFLKYVINKLSIRQLNKRILDDGIAGIMIKLHKNK